MSDLNRLSATDIVRRIRHGETTCAAVMADHIRHINDREPQVGAFQYLDVKAAMDKARAADRVPAKGPLHGVPFLIKDIIDTADMPTGWGFEPYANRRPLNNAICVQRFIDAGAIAIGKTVTTEFAYFKPGKTANPHHLDHTPGGSSSGSAAAVADFMAPLALGSQTAASLIRPAAYCGTTAFRPTFGGFDLTGSMGLSPSMDTLGVIARDIRDLELARSVLIDSQTANQVETSPLPPQVFLMKGPHWHQGEPEMRATCLRAIELISAHGGMTKEVAAPSIFGQLSDAQITVMAYEVARTRHHEGEVYRDHISPQFSKLLDAGDAISLANYHAALHVRDEANSQLEKLLDHNQVLLVPSAPGAAPVGLDGTGDPLFSRMWNLLQVPCVAVPCRKSDTGLPLGFQLITRRGADAALLKVAAWVERILR